MQRNKEIVDCLNSFDAAFDIDTARGVQLDTLGTLIGLSRNIEVPISGLFFTWTNPGDSPSGLGWEEGSWRDPSESSTLMTVLPDDAYRQVLKFKIIQNSWKGTADELYSAWEEVFGPSGLTLDITDNQDMSMVITITGSVVPATIQYILLGNYLPMKPSGVSVTYVFNET